MIIKGEDHLAHYGILRRSGRYPWGSGSTQSARNRSFLDTVENLRKQGMKDTEIARGFGMTTTQLRAARTIAINQQRLEKIAQAERLKEKGYSNGRIAERMGLPGESSVRALLAPGAKDKADILTNTADMLKREVEKKGMIDVGSGVELDLPIGDGGNIGISPEKFKTAVAMLEEQGGYKVHKFTVPQAGTGLNLNYKVLTKDNLDTVTVRRNRGDIKRVNEKSENGGRDWDGGPNPPLSMSSKRIAVRYKEDGGDTEDGVIHIRPGAKGLDLGKANYAQVRIAVDGTHYLKGVAVYKDNLPAGVDIVYNSNKKRGTPKMDNDPDAPQVFKPMERNPDGTINVKNPFTASIKPGGQRGHLNIVNEEGDWDTWSKSLPSQFLSKQSLALAKQQLKMTQEHRLNELAEIKSLTNPTVRKKLLETFADETDSSAVHLEAAAMKGQATKVILPINSVKPKEVYAPSLLDGTQVALVRFPHGGTFEIPLLTVNNRNPEAKKTLGRNPIDAIGIHHSVASRLSGADFDGDHVLLIPNNQGSVKNTPPLEGLKGFDPGTYKIPQGSGIPHIKPQTMQNEMGKISNLITDMTIKGANTEELARAVRHSMVVIDSEKHGLDYRRSEKDHGIKQLREIYQRTPGKEKAGGVSTLLSRSTGKVKIPKRRERRASEGGPIDPATGKKVFVPTGETRVDRKTGKIVPVMQEVRRGALVDDAHKLSSGHAMEIVYADHANQLKALANSARKEAVHTKPIERSPSAAKTYHREVQSLVAKLNDAKKNAPLERQAQAITTQQVALRRQANPNMTNAEVKKFRNKALETARIRTGASKHRIRPTQEEWNAIQAGAISPSRLEEILHHGHAETIRKLATPRTQVLMTSSKTARAKSMLAAGATQAEVASALGVSLSTLKASIAE